MKTWTIIAIYWALCIIGTYTVRLLNRKKKKIIMAAAREKPSVGNEILSNLGAIFLMPLFMPFVLFYLACKGIKSLYYRNRPRPIPKDKRKYLKPDTVLNEYNSSMSLAEYNYKHGTHFTLDQVYGRGYEASLTDEQRKDFHRNNENFGILNIQEGIEENEYTSVSINLAHALIEGDFSIIESYLSDNVETILYQSRTILGKDETLEYWNGWREKYIVTKKLTEFEVKKSNYYSKACLLINPMLIMFYLEGGMVQKILLINRNLSATIGHHDDLLDFPFSYEKIKRHLTPLPEYDEFNELNIKENRIPCLHCGKSSENLDWYKSKFDCGIHGYIGEVSVCPHCGKLVEYFPKTRVRYENAQFDKDDDTSEKSSANNSFIPYLYGINSFECSTPLKGTKYLENLPEEILKDPAQPFGRRVPDFGAHTIKQIAEECDWLLIRRMKEWAPEMYKKIKECYKKASDDGIYEAANILGILEYDFDGNHEEGRNWFDYSALHGSRDAMLNRFTAYWTDEWYQYGTSILEHIANCEKPSLKCLWNYAYLLYQGEAYPENFIEEDITKAKSILQIIIDYNPAEISENDKGLPAKAQQFLNYLEVANVYSEKGESYHKTLLESVIKPETEENKWEVFNRLTALKMKDGYHLGLRIADENTSDIGNESNFFAYNDAGFIDNKVENYLRLAPSSMAAWEVYLLMTSRTVMPVFWHGGYISRKFIFKTTDLDSIDALKYLDISGILENVEILPHVSVTPLCRDEKERSIEYIADVYCCYWNEWEGLVKEHARITMKDNMVANYTIESSDVLIEYDCGILF